MSALEAYWAGVLQRLRAEVDVFARLVNHMGERGRMNELALSHLLESFVPESTGVGTGLLIDSQDYQGSQTDVILFDQANQPAVMAQTTQVLFPVEVVQATIEVKTKLSSSDISDCIEKNERQQKLKPVAGLGGVPPFVVLAYNAGVSPQTITETFKAQPDHAPDLLCVLDLGLIGGKPDVLSTTHQSWTAGLALAQEEDGAGGWQLLRADPADEREEYKGHSAAVVAYGDQTHIADAGRALLLFADALARLVATRSSGQPPAFSNYLSDRTRRLELL
ncbi:MAG: DUF6602 domain-containing protein [Solirubrobacterales bacterium]